MPLVLKDRVRETTTTTGTGAITLAGPFSGFQPFSTIGNGNTTFYAISDPNTGAWEVGIGTYTLSGNTLSRDTVLESSNSGSLVNFAAGTKDAILTQPAERAVYVDGTSVAAPGATVPNSLLANSSITINGNSVSLGGSTTVTAATPNALTLGSYLSGGSFNGSAAVTTNVNAASTNTTGAIVARDGSGNFAAGAITATRFSGPVTGAVGDVTPSTGAFTTLAASSTVSGTGFSTYLASPPAIGSTAANTGAFTTLAASSTVSGTGFSTYLASPPAIGSTAANTGAFTTLTASANSTFSSTGALTISKGTTVQQPGSPVTGMMRYNTTTNQFEGYSGSVPAWKSIGGSALSNDTATASDLFPVFASATTGTAENLFTSNAQYLFKPSTGELSVKAPRASNGIVVNSATVTSNYTIATGDNGMSAGPVTVNSGVTVTVSSGSVWTVI